VARAKRTDRAEARRRYRAEMAGADGVDEGLEAETATGVAPARPASKQMSSPPGRLGIAGAFRASIHPINVRADVAALPKLATDKALFLPVAITIGSTVLVLATGASNFASALLYTYFVQSPAIGGVFLAGFLAPRASWLLGVIVGLLSALCYTVVIVSGVLGTPTQAVTQDVVVAAFVLSPILGGLFAAGAAWYRRFLQLSNPNRGRRADAKRGGNAGNGRSRSSGTAKTR
jgi:hypothetical protein